MPTPFQTSYKSPKELRSLARDAAEAVQTLEKIIEQAAMQTEERRKRLLGDIKGLSDRDRKRIEEVNLAEFRRTLVNSSQDKRTELFRQVFAASKAAKANRDQYRSPVQMLARETVGSAERVTFTTNLETAGNVELASMADFAASTGNRALVAAIVTRLHAMGKSRPFGPNEVASAVIGEEFQGVHEAIAQINLAFKTFQVKQRMFEQGRPDSLGKIELATAGRRTRVSLEDLLVDDEEEGADEA